MSVPAQPLRSPSARPEIVLATDWLKETYTPPVWLVDGWIQQGSRTLLFGPPKGGKTHVIWNLVRCLVNGEKFLETHDAKPLPSGDRVVVIDLELPRSQLRHWFELQRIRDSDQFGIVSLKGFAPYFNLQDSLCRKWWVEELARVNCKFLIVDCFAPAAVASGLRESDNTDAQAWLQMLDEIQLKANVDTSVLVHHTGHDGERARGASALLGWCDAWIKLSRKGDENTGQRYLEAVGRDVAQTKVAIYYDTTTHRFSTTPSSPTAIPPISVSQMKAPKVPLEELALQDAITLLMASAVPLNATVIIQLLKQNRAVGWKAHSDANVRDGLKLGAKTGVLAETLVGKELKYAALP